VDVFAEVVEWLNLLKEIFTDSRGSTSRNQEAGE